MCMNTKLATYTPTHLHTYTHTHLRVHGVHESVASVDWAPHVHADHLGPVPVLLRMENIVCSRRHVKSDSSIRTIACMCIYMNVWVQC